jgi:hypothetical protein
MAFRIRDLMINVGPQGGLGRQVVCGDSQAVCLDWTADFGEGCVDITIDPNCWLPSGNPYTCGLTCNTTGPTCGVTCPNYTCPPVTYRCPALRASAVVVTPVNWRAFASRDLATLKEQLRTALAEVEAQEKAAEEASRPRTREEAEELEEKLKGALEEVRGWKETLPGGGSK